MHCKFMHAHTHTQTHLHHHKSTLNIQIFSQSIFKFQNEFLSQQWKMNWIVLFALYHTPHKDEEKMKWKLSRKYEKIVIILWDILTIKMHRCKSKWVMWIKKKSLILLIVFFLDGFFCISDSQAQQLQNEIILLVVLESIKISEEKKMFFFL